MRRPRVGRGVVGWEAGRGAKQQWQQRQKKPKQNKTKQNTRVQISYESDNGASSDEQ
jgi:hypothetical protein